MVTSRIETTLLSPENFVNLLGPANAHGFLEFLNKLAKNPTILSNIQNYYAEARAEENEQQTNKNLLDLDEKRQVQLIVELVQLPSWEQVTKELTAQLITLLRLPEEVRAKAIDAFLLNIIVSSFITRIEGDIARDSNLLSMNTVRSLKDSIKRIEIVHRNSTEAVVKQESILHNLQKMKEVLGDRSGYSKPDIEEMMHWLGSRKVST